MVESGRLESGYSSKMESWVQIPPSPPFFVLKISAGKPVIKSEIENESWQAHLSLLIEVTNEKAIFSVQK